MWRIIARRDDDGAAAVEFALVLPILVLLLGGIVQFGYLYNQRLQVEHAAREGVRWASLRNTAASVEDHAIQSAPGIDLTGEVTIDPPDPTTALPDEVATVIVRHKAEVFLPFMELFLGTEVSIDATAVQRIE